MVRISSFLGFVTIYLLVFQSHMNDSWMFWMILTCFVAVLEIATEIMFFREKESKDRKVIHMHYYRKEDEVNG